MMIFTNCLKEYMMNEIKNILSELKNHPVRTLSLYDYIPRFRSVIPTNIKNYDQIIKELDNFKIHHTHENSRKTLISIIESIEYDSIDYEAKYLKLKRIFKYSMILLIMIGINILLYFHIGYISFISLIIIPIMNVLFEKILKKVI